MPLHLANHASCLKVSRRNGHRHRPWTGISFILLRLSDTGDGLLSPTLASRRFPVVPCAMVIHGVGRRRPSNELVVGRGGSATRIEELAAANRKGMRVGWGRKHHLEVTPRVWTLESSAAIDGTD